MKKKFWGLLLALALAAVPLCAFAQDMLQFKLPRDASLIEDVRFPDGEIIRTWQLAGGASIQLWRYTGEAESPELLIQEQWPDAGSLTALSMPELGSKSSAYRFVDDELMVSIVSVSDEENSFIWQAIYPRRLGDEQIETLVAGMLRSMSLADENDG